MTKRLLNQPEWKLLCLPPPPNIRGRAVYITHLNSWLSSVIQPGAPSLVLLESGPQLQLLGFVFSGVLLLQETYSTFIGLDLMPRTPSWAGTPIPGNLLDDTTSAGLTNGTRSHLGTPPPAQLHRQPNRELNHLSLLSETHSLSFLY